jgi:hypothetical protein
VLRPALTLIGWLGVFIELIQEEMTTKKITLCGKQVTFAYCFATEISYKILSEEDITGFIQEVADCLNAEPQQMPDIRKTIFLAVSSMQSYYDSLPAGQDGQKPKSPITDQDMMYHCTPQELGVAVGTILGLRAQFYNVPSDEPKDDLQDENHEEKNV